ncbi:MAG TPA: succinate dehydrogenase assembly factor 2 [Gammaproteobacteria bacterium]|nr:succinate dehydrogenase assembly factor 2 [Gammaproteobacteria bacterium]
MLPKARCPSAVSELTSEPAANRSLERNRLYWQCRRGMLELDALLLGFLDRRYDQLDDAGRAAFERLLSCPDPLLLDYLMARTIPIDKDVADVVNAIRSAVEP